VKEYIYYILVDFGLEGKGKLQIYLIILYFNGFKKRRNLQHDDYCCNGSIFGCKSYSCVCNLFPAWICKDSELYLSWTLCKLGEVYVLDLRKKSTCQLEKSDRAAWDCIEKSAIEQWDCIEKSAIEQWDCIEINHAATAS
jgi:hypothetical protein